MKVLHINTYDTGGAAIACIRLHLALLSYGVDSYLLTLNKTRSDVPNHLNYVEYERIKSPSFKSIFKSRLKNKLSILTKNFKDNNELNISEKVNILRQEASKYTDCFSVIDSPIRLNQYPRIEDFDIINLHWVADFLDWKSFFNSDKIKNVVWTIHDMSPFTGGYHYSGGYLGFKFEDSNPPFLQNTFDPDFAKKQLSSKRKIISNTKANIKIVSPSTWLHNCSLVSSLFSKLEHRIIPNSLNTSIFKKLDKTFCRQVLNIPQNKDVILFVSDHIQNKRKGFSILLDSLSLLNDKECILCFVGSNLDLSILNNQVYHLGKINDEVVMALAYNAADVFVLPSKEDNLPNVVLEALCCGTPVVGFNIGGMPDMISNGFNGSISEDISPKQLANSVNQILNNKEKYCSKIISIQAKKMYSPFVQSEAYKELYHSF